VQLAVLIAVCGVSSPIAVCALNVFCVPVIYFALQSFMVSAITDSHAAAAAMADFAKLSARSFACARMAAAAPISLSALNLLYFHALDWGNISYFPSSQVFLK